MLKKIKKIFIKKQLTYTVALFFFIYQASFGCTDILIDQKHYMIEARTLDFPVDLLDQNNQAYTWYSRLPIYQAAINQLLNNAFSYSKGYIGVHHISNVIIDTKDVPLSHLATWKTKYGYFGRKGFIGESLVDGMNTQGLSVSAMFLPGTEYPKYNPNDQRPALSVYEITDYVLGLAKTTKEAVNLLKQNQIVESSLKAIPGIFIKDIPLHMSIRDANGDSAVIEFINGKVVILPLGDVLTNAPDYPGQLQNTAEYQSLLNDNMATNQPNCQLGTSFLMQNVPFDFIKQPNYSNLFIFPEDSSSASRFIRANILLSQLPHLYSLDNAMHQAKSMINKMVINDETINATLWVTIKDLNNHILYYKDLYHYGAHTIIPQTLSNGYRAFNLNKMDFYLKDNHSTFETARQNLYQGVKVIYSLYDIPGIRSYFVSSHTIVLNH